MIDKPEWSTINANRPLYSKKGLQANSMRTHMKLYIRTQYCLQNHMAIYRYYKQAYSEMMNLIYKCTTT